MNNSDIWNVQPIIVLASQWYCQNTIFYPMKSFLENNPCTLSRLYGKLWSFFLFELYWWFYKVVWTNHHSCFFFRVRTILFSVNKFFLLNFINLCKKSFHNKNENCNITSKGPALDILATLLQSQKVLINISQNRWNWQDMLINTFHLIKITKIIVDIFRSI